MKTKEMFLLSALLVCASCNDDEPVKTKEGTPVAFKTFVSQQGRGTGASQDENANLQQDFGVFAYNNVAGVADASTPPNTLYNEKVTFTPGVGFDYVNTIYWPATTKLGFYAYTPYYASPLGTTGITSFAPANNVTPGVPGFTFTVDNNTNNQTDLLVAKVEGLNGGVVPLPFVHALSKVEVRAHTSGQNYRVAIMEVKLSGIYSTGDYSFTNAASPWNNQRTEANYVGALATTGNSKPDGTGVPAVVVLYNSNAANYTDVTDPANALYLMPQALGVNARLTITYNIYNIQSGNLISNEVAQELVIDLSDASSTLSGLVKWEKRRRILYNLNFIPRDSGPGSEVKFEATVTDWDIEYGDLS